MRLCRDKGVVVNHKGMNKGTLWGWCGTLDQIHTVHECNSAPWRIDYACSRGTKKHGGSWRSPCFALLIVVMSMRVLFLHGKFVWFQSGCDELEWVLSTWLLQGKFCLAVSLQHSWKILDLQVGATIFVFSDSDSLVVRLSSGTV